MKWGLFACMPAKIKAKCHHTLIVDHSFICVALFSFGLFATLMLTLSLQRLIFLKIVRFKVFKLLAYVMKLFHKNTCPKYLIPIPHLWCLMGSLTVIVTCGCGSTINIKLHKKWQFSGTNYYLLACEQALVIRTQDYSIVCLHVCKVSGYNTSEKTLAMNN